MRDLTASFLFERRKVIQNAMTEDKGVPLNSKLEKIFKLIKSSGILDFALKTDADDLKDN